MDRQISVLIVSAGPTGLTLALTLRRYGIAARVVDKLDQPANLSKALVVWPASPRSIERSGCRRGSRARGRAAAGGRFRRRRGMAHARADGRGHRQRAGAAHPAAAIVDRSDSRRAADAHGRHCGARRRRIDEPERNGRWRCRHAASRRWPNRNHARIVGGRRGRREEHGASRARHRFRRRHRTPRVSARRRAAYR
ncbi:Monooxygenase, FAD-binding [Candidatus Paraburkholderia calva]|nr:Monooxygenase, FAD-binding [Candidatus Paraburkholderia calva]